MPQGGGATLEIANSDSVDSTSSVLFDMVRRGTPWSGNEHNQLFLSCGKDDAPFIAASAATGFDYADDGRGMTLTDLDDDGDLDAIISNRNGPQLRILRNDLPKSRNGFVSIRLRGGEHMNRDSIGARVTLSIAGQPPLIRTLRAGEGFQSQNSKWLHFGVGQAKAIEKVTIRWPGGESETHSNLPTGKRYKFVYGESSPSVEPKRELVNASSKQGNQVDENEDWRLGRSITASRLPMPRITYSNADGELKNFKPSSNKKFKWIMVWASTCDICHAELTEIKNQSAALQQSDIQVLAVSIDGTQQGSAANKASAIKFASTLGEFVEFGFISPESIQKIQVIHDLIYEKRGEMPIPTNLLVDREGRLLGYIEGKLHVDQAITFTKESVVDSQTKLLSTALPFDGRWLSMPVCYPMSKYGNKLLEAGFVNDAIEITGSHMNLFSLDTNAPEFLVKLGINLEKQKRQSTAMLFFQKAVDLRPDNPAGHASLGIKYDKISQHQKAVDAFRASLKLEPSQNSIRFRLVNSLLKLNKNQLAADELTGMLKLNSTNPVVHAKLAAIAIKNKELKKAIGYLETTVKLKPDYEAARMQLGKLFEAVGQSESAIKQYQAVLKINPSQSSAQGALKRLTESKATLESKRSKN